MTAVTCNLPGCEWSCPVDAAGANASEQVMQLLHVAVVHPQTFEMMTEMKPVSSIKEYVAALGGDRELLLRLAEEGVHDGDA